MDRTIILDLHQESFGATLSHAGEGLSDKPGSVCESVSFGRETWRFVVFCTVTALGLAYSITAFVSPEDWESKIFAGVLVLLLSAYAIAWAFRQLNAKRQSTVYLDDSYMVGICRHGRTHEGAWAIRTSNIRKIAFTGGSFLTGPLEVWVLAPKIILRTRDKRSIHTGTASRHKIDQYTLARHPVLLRRLIELAEPLTQSPRRRKALKRARRYRAKPSKRQPATPPPYIVSIIEQFDAPETASPVTSFGVLRGPFLRQRLINYSLAYVAFGLGVFGQLRGSSFGFLVPILIIILMGMGSWRLLRPVRRLSRTMIGQLATDLTCGTVMFLVALFIWFYPVLWVVPPLYLIVLISHIARLEFGWKVERIVRRTVIATLVAFTIFCAVFFGNWTAGRSKSLFKLRYRVVTPIDLVISPDGKKQALNLVCSGVSDRDRVGEYVPARSSIWNGPVAHFVLQRWRRFREKTSGSCNTLLFVQEGNSEPTELILPGSSATLQIPGDSGPWSPDSRFLPLAVPISPGSRQIWVADPANRSVEVVFETSNTLLLLLEDAWSTDAHRLQGVVFDENSGTGRYARLLVTLPEKKVDFEPLPSLVDYFSSPPKPRTQYPPLPTLTSPDQKWRVYAQEADGGPIVTIEQKSDGKAVAQLKAIPALPEPEVSWSPDSRKVAISHPERTWVYDLQAGRTVCVKTWRRAEHCRIQWSPDSRSFYYVRHIVMQLFGLEIVQVTPRD